MAVSKKEISPCPIDALLTLIDGRWKPTILWCLLDGPIRPSELKRRVTGITERVLLRHLQELVKDELVSRHGDGAAVHYSISPYGESLVPVLEAVCVWGRSHLARKGAATADLTPALSA